MNSEQFVIIHFMILIVVYSLRKSKGKKEEEKQKEEEEVTVVLKWAGEGNQDKEWSPPGDPDFCAYVYEVTKLILPITNIREQIEALAK